MRITWLAWYVCGVCLLLALLASSVTYHPDIARMSGVLIAAFGSLALVAGAAAIVLGRLPATHWTGQSKPLWAGLVTLAVAATLFLVLVG